MTGPFGMGVGATAALLVVILLMVAVLARSTGRRMLADALAAVGRWPGLVRAELRGSAPLHRPDDGEGEDTTPDIPPVTRGLPVVDRHDRR